MSRYEISKSKLFWKFYVLQDLCNNETAVYVPLTKEMDNMKQPATILVLPVFYQNLPVSAILVQILVNTSILVSSRIFPGMSNYLSNIFQGLWDHTKYFDITGLLPLMLCTAEMTYEHARLWIAIN
jgi:hypothetical protein